MYGFEGFGLSEVQLSISELSVVDLGDYGTNALHGRTWRGSDKKFPCMSIMKISGFDLWLVMREAI